MIRNVAGQVVNAQMINASTGVDFSGVVTCYVTIDAGAQAIGTVAAGVCTLKGSGQYQYSPSAAETNGILIGFQFRGSGALTVTIDIATETAAQSTAQTLALNPNVVPLTAVSLITRALKTIGVLSSGDVPSGDMITDSFLDLNEMMGTLAIQPKTIPSIAREVFATVAGQGGTSNPYTIGPGGDFDTTRPASLVGAGILLGNTSPVTELQRAVLTDSIWQWLQVKDLSSSIFTGVYFNATFSAGLGEINLWPVPDNADNSVVLYRSMQLSTFASLTATYYIANGGAEMLRYQLAPRLAIVFQKPISSELREMSITTLATWKRANYTLFDLPTDPALTSSHAGWYDIMTGNQ